MSPQLLVAEISDQVPVNQPVVGDQLGVDPHSVQYEVRLGVLFITDVHGFFIGASARLKGQGKRKMGTWI